jgi:glyoxylase-like metal-dependent hydrolase (beta-lactamase superfamily II)
MFTSHEFGISTLDTLFLRPQLAASHLIVQDGRAALIDVGTNFSVPPLLEALQAQQVPVENVDYVIVTHVHLDHAGGAGKLLQALPNARLVVHPRGARHMIDPSKLVAGATAVYGEAEMNKSYGVIQPIAAERVIEAADGAMISLAGRSLVFLDTPGHAKHHFCIYDERSSSFFTGDTFGISYREFDSPKGFFIFATATPVQFDPTAMHNSINRLLSYQPKQMFLTHFGKIAQVGAAADKLHTSIDNLVVLMESVSDAGEQRHQLLVEQMMTAFLQEIHALNSPVSDSQAREILAMDIELNAQGLEVWWDNV